MMSVANDAGLVELRLAKVRFAHAVAHWRMDAVETAALLGLPTPPAGVDPLRTTLSEDAERRLRVATDVAHGLDAVFDERTLLDWLRDGFDEEVTPLAFMSRGVTELRAMRAAAAMRAS